MIRSTDWKYVLRYPYGPHELYNLLDDLEENLNLIDDANQSDVVASMREKLERWFVEYVDPSVDGTSEGVKGAGESGLAGSHAKGKNPYYEWD